MEGETLTESWIGNLWKTSRKSISLLEPEKPTIGILAFELASLMSKVINIWQLLSDNHKIRLREEIKNSVGIQKLVSENDDFLMDLALAEIVGNLEYVAKSVARLGKRCTDPVYHNLECIIDDPVKVGLTWFGWDYRLKKMERKVKKMERFVAATGQLHQELEVLAELEQSLRRMQSNVDIKRVRLLEFQPKVVWQRQEVKHLREMSTWTRTYDYIVRLLLRSLLTIVSRINLVYRRNDVGAVERCNDAEHSHPKILVRSNSMQPSVHSSETSMSRVHSGPLGRSISNLGIKSFKNRANYKKIQSRYESSVSYKKYSQSKYYRFANVGPFKGCMMSGSDSPILQNFSPAFTGSMCSAFDFQKETEMLKAVDSVTSVPSCCDILGSEATILNSKQKLLNASTSTLGGAALALHYANIIILIEKLASSPHLISHDARDDLYYLLPSSIKSCLRAKLKIFSKKKLTSSVYDAALAAEWSLALTRILEWLAPLAHNMIRWYSERNFEKRQMPSGTNVLLIQTLYFANQAKTEATIIELLMGLNYLSKFGEINETVFLESSCSRAYDDYLLHKDSIACGAIDYNL